MNSTAKSAPTGPPQKRGAGGATEGAPNRRWWQQFGRLRIRRHRRGGGEPSVMRPRVSLVDRFFALLKKPRYYLGVLLLLGGLFLFLANDAVSHRARSSAELNRNLAEEAAILEEIGGMESELEWLQTPEAVEELGRDQFGFVRPDDYGYIVPDRPDDALSNADPLNTNPTPPPAADEATTDTVEDQESSLIDQIVQWFNDLIP